MNIKHMSIGSYQKENDHLIVDLDKELPNLTDVRINGVWFEKSLLKNDEHTSAFYRNRAREEYRRLRELEQLCRDLYHAAWKHKCFAPDEYNSGNCINPEQDCEHCQWWKPAFERRMTDLGLLDGEQ